MGKEVLAKIFRITLCYCFLNVLCLKCQKDWNSKSVENCIAEQTFEVELSEYDGKVCFVPFVSEENNESFYRQLIQDGRILANIDGYVPQELTGQEFRSLDAVLFYDINYDNNTDIVLVVTYGDTSFAAVYYGYSREEDDYGTPFFIQEQLSKNLSEQVKRLSIPQL